MTIRRERDTASAPTGKRTAQYCHLCGRRLRSRYLVYNATLVVCAECDASCPRCARCGVPVAQPIDHGNGPVCANCAREAPRCAGCSLPITATWYTFEELLPVATPRKFCPRCVQSRPRCDLCRAPVAENAQPLADGQYRCRLCLSDVVLDDTDVQAIYAEAIQHLVTALHGPLRETPVLDIVTRREMGQLRRRYERRAVEPAAVANHHVLGYFVQSHGKSTVYVEAYLPRGLLLGTLAHELAHAWQTEQSLHLKDALVREGFAEWVAYRILIARGLTPLAERATRRDDVYGRGLRHFLNIENRLGYAGVIKRASGQPV